MPATPGLPETPPGSAEHLVHSIGLQGICTKRRDSWLALPHPRQTCALAERPPRRVRVTRQRPLFSGYCLLQPGQVQSLEDVGIQLCASAESYKAPCTGPGGFVGARGTGGPGKTREEVSMTPLGLCREERAHQSLHLRGMGGQTV